MDRIRNVWPGRVLPYDIDPVTLEAEGAEELGLVAGRHRGSQEDELGPERPEERADRTELRAEGVRRVEEGVALVQDDPVELRPYGDPVDKVPELLGDAGLGRDKDEGRRTDLPGRPDVAAEGELPGTVPDILLEGDERDDDDRRAAAAGAVRREEEGQALAAPRPGDLEDRRGAPYDGLDYLPLVPRKVAAGSRKSCRSAPARSARQSRASRRARRARCSSGKSPYRAWGPLVAAVRPPRPKPKKRCQAALTLRNCSRLAASPVVPCWSSRP